MRDEGEERKRKDRGLHTHTRGERETPISTRTLSGIVSGRRRDDDLVNTDLPRILRHATFCSSSSFCFRRTAINAHSDPAARDIYRYVVCLDGSLTRSVGRVARCSPWTAEVADPRCHCTGTRVAASIHNKCFVLFLFLFNYICIDNTTRNGRKKNRSG